MRMPVANSAMESAARSPASIRTTLPGAGAVDVGLDSTWSVRGAIGAVLWNCRPGGGMYWSVSQRRRLAR